MSSSFRTGRRVEDRDHDIETRPSVTPPPEQVVPIAVDDDARPQSPLTALNRPTKAEHLAELKRLLEESAVVEAMLLDTVAGRRPPASDASGLLEVETESAPHGRPRVRLALGAAAVAALVCVNAVALVQIHHRPSRTVRTASASTPTQVDVAASWVGRELSHNAKIVTDPTTRATLAAGKFTHAQAPATSRSGAALTFDYIVSTPALRAMASAGNAIDRALRSSLPIAVFGSGSDQVVVRQVSSASAADIAARRAADSDTRLTAGRQLLTNPAIRAQGAAKAALLAGQLDLRPATVLVLMANASHVEILSVNVDPAERAAGLPARSVDVRTDSLDDTQAMLTNLPPLYRPIADTQLPNGTHRLVWSIDPEPPPALN